MILLGFCCFIATGYHTDALTDNSKKMHLFGRLLQCIVGECLLVGKFLALNENSVKYVNCFVKSQFPIQISVDITGFLLFRASGKQTGALNPISGTQVYTAWLLQRIIIGSQLVQAFLLVGSGHMDIDITGDLDARMT